MSGDVLQGKVSMMKASVRDINMVDFWAEANGWMWCLRQMAGCGAWAEANGWMWEARPKMTVRFLILPSWCLMIALFKTGNS